MYDENRYAKSLWLSGVGIYKANNNIPVIDICSSKEIHNAARKNL